MPLQHIILLMYYLCEKFLVKLPKLPVADLNWETNFTRRTKHPHPHARNI